MQDFMTFKGYFKVQVLDKNMNVIEEEGDNLIMTLARTTMAEIFSGKDQTSVSGLVLGTLGHQLGAPSPLITPKTAGEGFTNARTRLFSEYIEVHDALTDIITAHSINHNDIVKYTGVSNITGTSNYYYKFVGANGSVVNALTTDYSDTSLWMELGVTFTPNLNDMIKYVGPAASNNGVLNQFYIFLGSTAVDITTTNFADVGVWTDFGAVEPYKYFVDFTVPPAGDSATVDGEHENQYGADLGVTGTTVDVTLSGTSTEFSIYVPADVANNGVYAEFTEAALYGNGRIFSMKPFRVKLKDDSSQLRIIWTITF